MALRIWKSESVICALPRCHCMMNIQSLLFGWMNEPLKKVGKYRFIKRIGKGATSQVYEAKKQGCGDKFAIKMIRLKGLNNQQRQIIQKEVNIIKSISHPNIVHIDEAFETTNNFYLVFEYCERGDLEKYLAEFFGAHVPEETAQKILYCIADAVSLIHSKGIAHRDLKLANILIKKDYQIKLADFGFAKETESILMQTYCGTPITMAPEIMLSKPYDKKCDLWSLGVIAFQLIYGKLPFSISEGLPKFMEYVTTRPLEIPSQPTMPAEFKQLLVGCLQKEASKRCDIQSFLLNPWILEGSDKSGDSQSKQLKPAIDELLRNISQEVNIQKMSTNEASEIELLVAQRVNKIMVQEIEKLLKMHVELRKRLDHQVSQQDDSMRNLLFKLDHTYLDFLCNLPIRIGKENSSQSIKVKELSGLQFPQPLSSMQMESDLAGNVILKYLQKTAVLDAYSPAEKIVRYNTAIEFLSLIKRFDLRVLILFANHIYEDIEIENIIHSINSKEINEEVNQQIEFTKGNFITIAMECCDKDDAVKTLRTTLQDNLRRRVRELEKDIF